MEKIGRRIWTYLPDEGDEPVLAGVDDVASSGGFEVRDYPDLVHRVATIGYHNARYSLYFRGQGNDHRLRKRDGRPGRSSVYASIYRTGKRSLPKKQRERRLARLEHYTGELAITYPGHSSRDKARLRRFRECGWALLQHYQVCPTPLIDVTQSLRVASSFATEGREDGLAYVYVFGLPDANGSISFFADQAMVLVRLQSVCPPEAKRAHFQEGYLVGQFPWVRKKYAHLNLANRMLAKFAIRIDGFWSEYFPPIRHEALMPEDDELLGYFDDLEDHRTGL